MRSPETPRQRRRAERIETIKEEALALVLDDGIESFSVHRLADRLDLTVGALYRYFESVDHLLAALQVDVLLAFDAFFGGLEEDIGPRGQVQWVIDLAYAYLALSELAPERFRLIARFVSSLDPMLKDEAAANAVEPTLRLFGRLASAIESAQESGSLRDGDAFDRGVIMWSCLHGLIERRKLARLNPSFFDLESMSKELVSTLLIGWGADPAEVVDAIDNRVSNKQLKSVLEQHA